MAQLVSQLTRQTIKNLSCVNTIKYLSCQKKPTAHVYARTITTTSILAGNYNFIVIYCKINYFTLY